MPWFGSHCENGGESILRLLFDEYDEIVGLPSVSRNTKGGIFEVADRLEPRRNPCCDCPEARAIDDQRNSNNRR